MKYHLMHKNIQVAEIEFNERGVFQKIADVFDEDRLPFGTKHLMKHKMVIDDEPFYYWWRSRCIPASREGFGKLLDTFHVKSPDILLIKCYGLSLSDQYWIRPENSDINWEDVNFFDNDFSEDIGKILFGEEPNNEINVFSADMTSDGQLKKKWKIINGERCLIKGGRNPFHQEPINEVIATIILKNLEVEHIPYELIWEKGKPYSVCKDFITKDTDLISAYRLLQKRAQYNHENDYLQLLNICDELGIKGMRDFLDRMIVFDYLILNEDRHFNNFGMIRDANTLQWLGTAPIYDSGTSLGYNRLNNRLFETEVCKPFKRKFGEQLSLVTSFDWFEIAKLNEAIEEVDSFLSTSEIESILGEGRRESIVNFLSEQSAKLDRILAYNSRFSSSYHVSFKEDKSEHKNTKKKNQIGYNDDL